jgi:hypothetical protein
MIKMWIWMYYCTHRMYIIYVFQMVRAEFSFCLSMMWFSLSGCSYCSFFLKFWGDFIVPYNFCRSGGFLCSWTIPSCLGLCTLALPCYVLLADWFGAARSAMPYSVLQIHFDVFFARKGEARSAIPISISCWGTLLSYVVPHSRVRRIKIGRWMAIQRGPRARVSPLVH